MREYLVVWAASGKHGVTYIKADPDFRMNSEELLKLQDKLTKREKEQVIITSFQLLEEPY